MNGRPVVALAAKTSCRLRPAGEVVLGRGVSHHTLAILALDRNARKCGAKSTARRSQLSDCVSPTVGGRSEVDQRVASAPEGTALLRSALIY